MILIFLIGEKHLNQFHSPAESLVKYGGPYVEFCMANKMFIDFVLT